MYLQTFYIIRTEDKMEKSKQNSTSLMLRPCSPEKLVIFGIKAKVNKHLIAKSTMLSFSLDSMASYLYTSYIPLISSASFYVRSHVG